MRLSMILAIVLIIAAACVASATACGCSPASSPTVSERAIARGAVSTLEAAWVVGAETCRSIAVSKNDSVLAIKCENIFLPVLDSIKISGVAIDAWTQNDAKNMPCLLADIVHGFFGIETLLVDLKVTVPPAVAQGLELAQALAPQCVRQDAAVVAPDSAPDTSEASAVDGGAE
jgi:hypothetical protein